MACGFEQGPFAKIPIKVEIVQVYFFLDKLGKFKICVFVKSLETFSHFADVSRPSVVCFRPNHGATRPGTFGEQTIYGHFLR